MIKKYIFNTILKLQDKNVYKNGQIYVYFFEILINTMDMTSIIIVRGPT